MKKQLLLSFILSVSLFVNAQYAIFKLSGLSGKINNEKIAFKDTVIEIKVQDTTDYIVIGKNESDERIEMKFFLTKVSAQKGVYYCPSYLYYFLNAGDKNHDKEVPKLDLNSKMGAQYPMYKSSGSASGAFGNIKGEFGFSIYVDGKNLDYADAGNQRVNNQKIELTLTDFIISYSKVFTHKDYTLTISPDSQRVTIGTFNNKPVVLEYVTLKCETGKREDFIFYSTITYTDAKGKEVQTSFLDTKTGRNAISTMRGDCNKKGKRCKQYVSYTFDLKLG